MRCIWHTCVILWRVYILNSKTIQFKVPQLNSHAIFLFSLRSGGAVRLDWNRRKGKKRDFSSTFAEPRVVQWEWKTQHFLLKWDNNNNQQTEGKKIVFELFIDLQLNIQMRKRTRANVMLWKSHIARARTESSYQFRKIDLHCNCRSALIYSILCRLQINNRKCSCSLFPISMYAPFLPLHVLSRSGFSFRFYSLAPFIRFVCVLCRKLKLNFCLLSLRSCLDFPLSKSKTSAE